MDNIGRIERALRVFRSEVKADVKVQHLVTLIALMLHEPEPLSYDELVEVTGTSRASVSRATKLLGVDMVQIKRDGPWKDQGLGLVDTRPDPYHPRQYVVRLTSSGLKLRDKLNKALS